MKRNDHPTIGRRGRLARSLATATSLARSFEPETDRPSVEKSRQFIGGRHCTDCPKYHGAAARQPASTATMERPSRFREDCGYSVIRGTDRTTSPEIDNRCAFRDTA